MSLRMMIPVVELGENGPKGIVDYVDTDELFAQPRFAEALEKALEPDLSEEVNQLRAENRRLAADNACLQAQIEEQTDEIVALRTALKLFAEAEQARKERER